MPARTEAATAEHMARAAQRAACDPIRLGRATRTVQAAIRLGLLTPADVLGHPVTHQDGAA